MNRYFIYIFIGLMAFAIGSFAALNFYKKLDVQFSKTSKPQIPAQNLTERKLWDDWNINNQPIQEKELPKEPFCKDAKILPLWNLLIKDKSFKDWWEVSRGSFDCSNALEIKEFDLNNDGQKEFLMRGKGFPFCSAVGNCAFWIYQKKGKKYRKLLYSTDYTDITELPNQIKKSRTKKFLDIVLKGHQSAADTSYDFFKFDGKKYRLFKSLVHACTVCVGENPKWKFMTWKEYEKRSN